MLLQKTLLALASCSLFSVAAFAQTPPSPYQNVAASSLQPRHGSPAIPISRQYQCYKEGGYYWPADGSGIPQSDCKAAYQLVYHKYLDKSGIVVPKKEGKKSAINSKKNAVDIIEQSNYQFRQWNEASKNVADYNNPDAVKAAIPDGQLCSAGNVGAEWDERSKVWNDKSGLDAVTAWRATDIQKTSEGKIDIVYDATATHDPSFFEVYISRPDYNAATAPLKWSDLVLLEKVENVKPENQQYKFAVNAKDYTGKHVIYIRWQRIDPVGEGFYSCSDVNIKG
ncbi:lytic polysaccharide monooxygenase [Serratia sp. IR-2025]|uniref:lytic polysaccharide monooxygenase n=1 Tax=Serratia nevei TaxID=2703794 RepID=UPI0027D275D5|nr:lytic polysaccharide monooxygenase [Serratia nevei]MDR8480644.1 lytic polysaccharide monooxygenase [Serratia nevei]WMC73857.1 lytic polysaccharide monooxygenase [Serratia nevei]WMC79253.1 lytic polysaccharide monooxygenase [Serratia nevei]